MDTRASKIYDMGDVGRRLAPVHGRGNYTMKTVETADRIVAFSLSASWFRAGLSELQQRISPCSVPQGPPTGEPTRGPVPGRAPHGDRAVVVQVRCYHDPLSPGPTVAFRYEAGQRLGPAISPVPRPASDTAPGSGAEGAVLMTKVGRAPVVSVSRSSWKDDLWGWRTVWRGTLCA